MDTFIIMVGSPQQLRTTCERDGQSSRVSDLVIKSQRVKKKKKKNCTQNNGH